MQHPACGRPASEAIGLVFAEETRKPDVCPICQEVGDQRLNLASDGTGPAECHAKDAGANHTPAEMRHFRHFPGLSDPRMLHKALRIRTILFGGNEQHGSRLLLSSRHGKFSFT